MRKALISGGAGFIGYHLTNYLLRKARCEVHIVDDLSRGKIDGELKALIDSGSIKFISADLTRQKSYELFDDDYTHIFHLSGIVGVKNVLENPDSTLRINTVSVLNMLEWIKRTQNKLKRFLFASTSEVYAGTAKHFKTPIPTNESVALCLDDIRSQRTTYALSKMVGESACFAYHHRNKIPFTIVRYHNVYGPRMGCEHVIPELMMRARTASGQIGVWSVRHKRAFCYVSDAVIATVKLAQSPSAIGQIFNVGNDEEELPIGRLAEKIISVVKPGLKVKPLSDMKGSPLRRCPDISRIKRIIKFKPQVSLDEGIRLTWESYKDL